MRPKGLLLPGYACTSHIWQPVIALLGAEYDLEVVDWPLDLTPGFHAIDDFALWLHEHHRPRACDVIVGHSMGGLVALRLSAVGGVDIARIILVETFLSEPSPFFRNTLMPDTAPALHESVATMLSRQQPYFSTMLRDRARRPDVAPDMFPSKSVISVVYGDRGCADQGRVMAELGWPEPVRSRVGVAVAPKACHFPMLECPEATSGILRSLLG